jgi:thiosulfate reductase cytochrome b subunit
MIPRFSDAERAIQYPPDRRLRISMKPRAVVLLAALTLGPALAAWIQYLATGLPQVHDLHLSSWNLGDPRGFPAWICVSHWVNFFFMTLMMRSGLSILMDHPRLYWNDHCTPDTEWIRLTPLKVPRDRVWTAKDDARYLPPLIGLPGYRHTIGLARVWHFLAVPFFVLNGLVFIGLLFLTHQWKRLVPASWDSVPQAWSVFVHYVTLHMPPEPNGFYQFNPLQQISYFCVVFVMAPLSMLTGVAMSPALESRFPWYGKLFCGRQGARSLHFMLLLGYLGFTAVHVAMIAITGFTKNMNHITRGADDSKPTGMIIGLGIIGMTGASWFMAHWLSWRRARALQHLSRATEGLLRGMSLAPFKPRDHYTQKDISPYFWPNGKLPTSSEWLRLAEGDFKDFKLTIGGLVENPVELTLEDLARLGKEGHVTIHHCIQGWTGIAQWGGVSLKKIVDLVNPKPGATTVAFTSFGEGLYGGAYYDTLTLENLLKPQSILAWEMNDQPLPRLHGAPLRLRVENQLGYKMVKWIKSIEFVESHKTLGKGEGGKNEDDEYFDLIAGI